MIHVIPVSKSDIDKAPLFVKVLQHFGGLKHHRAVIAPIGDITEAARKIFAPLEEEYDRIDFLPLQYGRTPANSWPHPCNLHFKSLIVHGVELVNAPWMWLELDSSPTRKGWADDLQTQYFSAGKPFMGVVRETADAIAGESGHHMVGFGIYPAVPKINEYSRLWQYPSIDIPFDIFWRHDIVKNAHNSQLIIHSHGCRGFRNEDGRIFGIAKDGTKVQVDSYAAILHGVKDESLAKTILGIAATSPAIRVDNMQKPSSTPIISSSGPYLGSFSLDDMVKILQSEGYYVSTQPTDPESIVSQKVETINANNLQKRRGRPKLKP